MNRSTLQTLVFATIATLSLGIPMTASRAIDLPKQVTQLREKGPAGLQEFLNTHADQLAPGKVPTSEVRQALDTLCQQRDCHASRLYWYTDLEKAKAAAVASGKPILSLRLLGRLDQDLSCANSRFFRVALYPNSEVSKYLRDRFILHWQSVRPVPTVTINFGNGRTLERTLTGNSIHYILDSAGRPIEALPGLYGPQAFLRHLQQADQLSKRLNQSSPDQRETQLRQYHRDRAASIQTQWTKDLRALGITTPPRLTQTPIRAARPNAAEAGAIAVTKSVVENPLITGLGAAASRNQAALIQITDEAIWQRIADRHAKDAQLDANSLAVMRLKKPDTLPAMIQKFEAALRLDTVRNEYLLHHQLHEWFVQGRATQTVDTLNEVVYAELFLTPNHDPWLGLLSDDSFSAIENDGIK